VTVSLDRQGSDALRTAIEGLSVVAFETGPDGKWVLLNRAWEELTGYPVSQSLGRPFLNYVHPDDRATNLARFMPLARGEKDGCRHEIRYVRSDGEAVEVEIFARALRASDGAFLGTVGTLTDITARKDAERQAAEALAFAEVLAEIARLSELDSEPASVAASAAEIASRVTPFDCLGLVTVEGDLALMRPVWRVAGVNSDAYESQVAAGIPKGKGIVWRVLEENAAYFVDDYARAPRALPAVLEAGLRSMAWLPIGGNHAPVCVLAAARLSEARPWSARDQEVLAAVGRVVAAALERREHLAQLERAAFHDPLTGLGNRRAFEADLERELAQASRHGHPVTVLVLDLDGLKKVNDRSGHQRGDALLRAVTNEISNVLRRADGLFRLGGDEFAVILDHTGPSGFAPVLRRVREVVAAVRAGGFPEADISAGMASFPLEATTPGELFRLADERMYSSKEARKLALAPLPAKAESPRAVSPAAAVPAARHDAASGIAWRTLRSTISLLAGNDGLNDATWTALLEAVLASVPGADAGSFNVLERDQFVLRATVGYNRGAVGTRFAAENQVNWYGLTLEDYRAARPRVMSGAEFRRRSSMPGADAASAVAGVVLRELDEFAAVVSTLCIPIVVDGEVAGHLNLESFTEERAFGPEAVRLAAEFASQAAALLAAQARSEREAHHLRELEALSEVNQALQDTVSIEDAERVLAEKAGALLDTEDAVFLRFSPGDDALISTVRLGRWAGDVHYRPRGQGFSWGAISAGAVLVSPDGSSDPRVADPVAAARHAMLSAPLRSPDGTLFGTIVAARPAARPFSPLETRLARAIAAAGVTALDRIMALRSAACRAAEAERAREGALHALGLALEARDFETRGHTERVLQLSLRLATALGLEATELEALRVGAYLHDIGKLGLSDAILLKAGPLDPEERAVVERHALLGFDLARAIPGLPRGALEVVRYHHERWDGRGYPDGLTADGIPLLARIFSVADVFDALLSQRPYKASWTRQAAVSEIARQAGLQFDPLVVSAFLRVTAES
jgi:diguanylate cyclase (GGDEF)-like protein/PAS domain S-box-containing protein